MICGSTRGRRTDEEDVLRVRQAIVQDHHQHSDTIGFLANPEATVIVFVSVSDSQTESCRTYLRVSSCSKLAVEKLTG